MALGDPVTVKHGPNITITQKDLRLHETDSMGYHEFEARIMRRPPGLSRMLRISVFDFPNPETHQTHRADVEFFYLKRDGTARASKFPLLRRKHFDLFNYTEEKLIDAVKDLSAGRYSDPLLLLMLPPSPY